MQSYGRTVEITRDGQWTCQQVKNCDTRPRVHFMGTPGTGVIVVWCKSPVRDWKLSSDSIQND